MTRAGAPFPSTATSPRDQSTLTSDHRGVTPESLEQARRDNELTWLRRERVRHLAFVRDVAAAFPACGCRGFEAGCIHARAAKLDADSAANEARVGADTNGGRAR